MGAAILLLLSLTLCARPAGSATQFMDGAWTNPGSGDTAPSARREYSAIYDDANQRYLLFAGFFGDVSGSTYVLFNQVWALSLGDSPTWSPVPTLGSSPGPRHSPQWGYDPAQHRLLVFGGYGSHHPGDRYDYLNDVWQLSLEGTPTWTELSPSGTPPTGRLGGTAVYDPLRQRFVGFGGTIGLPVDTWELDLAGDPAWASVPTDSVSPKGGYGMTGVFDPVRDRLVIFGGSTSDNYYGVQDNVWALDLDEETPAWHPISPTGTSPAARRSGTSVYDPLRDRMVIFGGWDGGVDTTGRPPGNPGNPTPSFLGDTWSLSFGGDPGWSQLQPTGEPPAGRDAMAAAYDPAGDRMVVFGGWSGNAMLGDTWFLAWGGSSQPAAVFGSDQSTTGVTRVQWNVQHATGPHAAVYRRTLATPWTSVATLRADAAGTVTYVDPHAVQGARYGYKIAVSSQRGELLGGEMWVNAGVSSAPPAQAPLRFALEGARPNPVVGRFRVRFAIPTGRPARLELFDLNGRRAASRDVGALGAGEHSIDLGSAGDFAPGVYFLRLMQGSRTTIVRAVVAGGSGPN